MKKLLFFGLILAGCKSDNPKGKIITSKIFKREYQYADKICGYTYQSVGAGSDHYFEDSCNKYNVGDTIR